MEKDVKLTEFSHGAGCGCKISPKVLDSILKTRLNLEPNEKLLVGNSSKDDAAVYDMGNRQGIISTTDFFMPIVDDPFDFGRIAATNAISDIYAMGGAPLMAIAILGWPINKLSEHVAQQVVDGGRQACKDAGILLAGGHSIDSPEPIFGLAVTGTVPLKHLKRNNTATASCRLYLTKPLGVGILTTAQKKKLLKKEHMYLARDSMCQLNTIGMKIGRLKSVKAMTDVTGFGLLGHLCEICEGSNLNAQVDFATVPILKAVHEYLAQGSIPGGTLRNFDSYGHKISPLSNDQKHLLCDPQTSGGLLIAVEPEGEDALLELLKDSSMPTTAIGYMTPREGKTFINVL